MLRGETKAHLSISSLEKKPMTKKWTADEISHLKECYKESSKRQLLSLFPGRTWKAIQIKAERLGVLKLDGKAIHVHNNGYVLMRYPNYPVDWRGKWKDGRVYEHNLVWFLCNPNDPIRSDESIHHVNGNKQDNRIENLQKLKDDAHGYFTKTGNMPVKFSDPQMQLPPEIEKIDATEMHALLEEAAREEIERELANDAERDSHYKR